jgi:hypothetical protein
MPTGDMGVEWDCWLGSVLMESGSVRRGWGEWVRRRFLLWRASSSVGLTALFLMGGRVVDMLSLAKACAKEGNMSGESEIEYIYLILRRGTNLVT